MDILEHRVDVMVSGNEVVAVCERAYRVLEVESVLRLWAKSGVDPETLTQILRFNCRAYFMYSATVFG
ncbi:hypothetical protein AQ730_10745 [Burkholderia pseudomallei]|nr:hypothetical protein AQ730_10745 [Burkholderia pseudomallei]